jgi:hypothetical protein
MLRQGCSVGNVDSSAWLRAPGARMSTVTYTLDRSASSSTKRDVIARINSDLGNKASISGDLIKVDSFYESKVQQILNRANIRYTRG